MGKLFPNWLDEMIGPPRVEDEGVELPKRALLDFKGAGVVATDDPGTGKTVVTISGAAVSATGTGFVHVTAGVTDAAARAVDLASSDVTGSLPVANGGTGLSAAGANNTVLHWAAGALVSALIVNANVDAAAAIAGTKIAPDFGAQLVQTTGGVRGGYVELTSGGPKITKGAGAPAAGDPDGSLYLRTDGTSSTTAYVRAAGAWTALGGSGSGTASSGYDTADHGGGGQEVLNITGTGGIAKVRGSAALAFGDSGYATIGLMRLKKGADGADSTFTPFVAMRDHAGTGDISLVGGRWNTTSSVNEMILGDATALGIYASLRSDGLFIIYTPAGPTSAYPFIVSGSEILLGLDTAVGVPLTFGIAAAQTGNGLRFPAGAITAAGASPSILVSARKPDNSGDRKVLILYQDSNIANREVVGIGFNEADLVLRGCTSYGGWSNAIGGFFISKNDGTPPLLQLGDGGTGTIKVTTGAGAPAAAAPDGSWYARNDGTNGATGLYTRQGGVWYAVGGASSSGVTWSTDLNTSTDTVQKVVQITGSGGVCNVVNATRLAFLTTGGHVALTGRVAGCNAEVIVSARRADNNADLPLLGTTSGDSIQIGGSGGLAVASPAANGVGVSGWVEIGLSVAGSGTVRLPNPASHGAAGINFRNKDDNGDIAGVNVDNANNIVLGGAGTAGAYVDGVNGATLRVSGVNVLACSSGQITALQGIYAPFFKAASGGAIAGLVRGALNTVIVSALHSLGNQDIGLLQTDGANNVYVGGAPAGATTLLRAADAVNIRVGNNDYVTVTPGLTSIWNVMQLVNAAAPSSKPSGGPKVWGDAGRFAFWGSNNPVEGRELRIAYDAIVSRSIGSLLAVVRCVFNDPITGVPTTVGYQPIYAGGTQL